MSLPAILQQLTPQQTTQPLPQHNVITGIKNTISAMKSVGDPAKLAEILLQSQNPAIAKAMDYIKQNGGNPELACKKLLQENGIDPAEVMNLIK